MDQARALAGRTMHGTGGEKLGKIDTLYADRDGGEPTFATVHTGAFGTKTSFVPLAEATMTGEDVTVPYGKDLLHSAPSIDPDAELEPAEEQRIYQHYGVGDAGSSGTEPTATTQRPANDRLTDADDAPGTVGRDTSGPTTDDAMTRSEERLTVGTQQTESGRARLRKYIVTENVQQTVPVSREEVRVTREPITEGNSGAAYDGPALSEEEHEVVLHEERPIVSKETVAVERVRLGTETVTEQHTVNEEVRKEQIDTDNVYPEGDARSQEQTRR